MSLIERINEIVAIIERLSRKLDGIRGPGVTHTPTGITIAPPPRKTVTAAGGGDDAFYARVSGSTKDGTNFRWSYDFVEVVKTSAGFGTWNDMTGGRTGTLRNLLEDQNGESGLMGNGVNTANLTGTFALQPIPTGTRVRVEVVEVTGVNPEYWTSYENGVDGACS